MAEFSEVMRNIQRRCKACGAHVGCTIPGTICAHISDMPHDADWNALEKEVMSWAAEHPGPVYPTWGEWLLANRIIGDADSDYAVGLLMRCKRIPADIAQKLGIEPKEG